LYVVLRVLAYCFSKQQILDSRILWDILSQHPGIPEPRRVFFSIYVAGPQHPNSPSKWSSSNLYFRNFRGPFIYGFLEQQPIWWGRADFGHGRPALLFSERTFFLQYLFRHTILCGHIIYIYFVWMDVRRERNAIAARGRTKGYAYVKPSYGWTCGGRGMQLRRVGGPPDQTRAGIRRPQQQGTSHTFEPIIAPQMYVPQPL